MIFLIPNGIITLPGGISFNRTILSFYLLVVVIFKEKKLDLGISKYVFFYYISLLLVIFLTSDEVPISFQLKTFIRSFVADGVLLYVLYYTTIKHTNAYVFFSWTIIILILITTIYGFFNASFLGSNPYLKLFSFAPDQQYEMEIEMGDSGRLFGRVTSIYLSPWYCGNFLTISGIFLIFLYQKIRKRLWEIAFLGIIFFSFWIFVIISGNRSALAILIIFYTIYMYSKIQLWKSVAISITIIILFIFVITPNVPFIETYIESLYSNSNKVTGSSVNGRIEQLFGCYEEWSNAPLFGHGYNWSSYYRFSHNGNQHPTMLGFESIIFIQVCNLGLYGCIMTYYMFYYLYNRINKKAKDAIYIMCGFLSYSLVTGIYGSYETFIVFYITSVQLLASRNLKYQSKKYVKKWITKLK